jgi:phosphoribosylformylglycinamidine synthase
MTTAIQSDSLHDSSVRPRVWRVEVHPQNPDADPRAASIRHEVRESALAPDLAAVRCAAVYLFQTALDQAAVERIADQLLTDPVTQRYRLGATPREEGTALIEVHYLPGVMDPVAQSTADAVADMFADDPHARALADQVQVRTGMRYDLVGIDDSQARRVAEALLANPVIQSISDMPEWPKQFPAGSAYHLHLSHVPIRDLDDEQLMDLSRKGHLFLSLDEMRAIADYFRSADRDPTDIELETLAQTWSEHCVHKTLKSKIRYTETGTQATPEPGFSIDGANDRPGHRIDPDGSLTIDNLLKSTIAAATHQLRRDGVDWCISVFEDNAGVIEFDESDAITFKVETHNHPSAIEPYGGAATGIGGCIRDTIGTGLAAQPVANTDVFCVGFPDNWRIDQAEAPGEQAGSHSLPDAAQPLPRGILHPRRILKQVVAGVRDYGNRMGIPTINGAVYFDDRYLGNPLVFCGSVGLIPRDKCFGDARPGDRIIALGGRTGRDGIHGATFSSAELTDTHADEFSHAVQIGNAITEKKTLDVIMQARDHESGPLFNAITDCGAGGFSSAVGEMGEKLGAQVQLDNAPLKYAGLSYTEIWISEAQERMVLAVPPTKVDTLWRLCQAEDVEACDLGYFGTDDRQLILRYGETEVGRLSMAFLHEGLPQPVREAVWHGARRDDPADRASATGSTRSLDPGDIEGTLHALLGHPNLASKHWIIRQYDHEVQGGAAVRPLTGAKDDGPSDAAVFRPKVASDRAVALSLGLATALGDTDPYWMTLAAIDEAVRNAVCVGADPGRIAILDNFCWANCQKPEHLGALVRAAEACYDGALAYRTPFISGKDSLNNEFKTEAGRTIAIPPTLLISAMGIVHDANRCVTMDAKQPGNLLIQVGWTDNAMGGSHYQLVGGRVVDASLPRVNLATAPKVLATVAQLIASGQVHSAHDCSEGGLLVAASEMAFAGRLGLAVDLAGVPRRGELSTVALCFAETPTRILLEVSPDQFGSVADVLSRANIPFGEAGRFNESGRLTVRNSDAGPVADESLDALRQTWIKPLDW